MMKTNSPFRFGFTLVELMVAIVILGVLAAVAVVGYSKYTTNARLAEAHAGIDNLGKAQITYFLGAKRFINYQINPSGHTMYNPGFNKIKPHSDLGNDPSVGWQIGYPFPPGTEVWFTYSGANSEVQTPTYTARAAFRNKSPLALCPDVVYTVPEGQAQPLRSVLLRASRDFKASTADNDPCTDVWRVIDTDPQGKVRVGPLVTVAAGE